MAQPGVMTGSVVVRDGRIAYAGPVSEEPRVAGARVIDGRGRCVIPGLIDLHTHVSKSRGSSLVHLVAHGVTTVRDMGGDHEELLQWRAQIDGGQRVGPRLLIAGPYLESARNAARQHGTPVAEMIEPVERTRIGVATPAHADRIVAAIAARGVDHLKIRTTQDRATYVAIGEAARRHGLPLTGHAQPYPAEATAAARQASIEHVILPLLQERAADERLEYVRTLARANVAVVPTLVVLERLGGPSDEALARVLADAAGGRFPVSAFLRADWREQLAEQGPERREFYAKALRSVRRDFAELRAAGVRVLAGSDAGVLNVFPGQSLQQEVALLVRDAGMSSHEALAAATSASAQFLGIGSEVGTITSGKRADLVLLDGNPLHDVAQVSRVSGVVVRGRFLDRAGLDALLAETARAADITTNDWPRLHR